MEKFTGVYLTEKEIKILDDDMGDPHEPGYALSDKAMNRKLADAAADKAVQVMAQWYRDQDSEEYSRGWAEGFKVGQEEVK